MFSLLFIPIQALLRLVFLKYICGFFFLHGLSFRHLRTASERIAPLSVTGSNTHNGRKACRRSRGIVPVGQLIISPAEPIKNWPVVLSFSWNSHLSASSAFRARSIYERALDVDHRNITLWLKYAEMEMKNRQVNHARNIWDRAITILPRANQFWYKWC